MKTCFQVNELEFILEKRERAYKGDKMLGYFSAHFIQRTAMIPPTIAPDARKIATLCQKSMLPAKKARYSTMKANQQTIASTVPAALFPRDDMAGNLRMKS